MRLNINTYEQCTLYIFITNRSFLLMVFFIVYFDYHHRGSLFCVLQKGSCAFNSNPNTFYLKVHKT